MSVWPSCKGHIVRIVAISEKGIVVDDPYGNVDRTKSYANNTRTGFEQRENCSSGGYDTNNNSNSNKGKHNLWEWEEINGITLKGIIIFGK